MAIQIDSFVYSNIGGRSANEDSVGERRWDTGGVFVVADGLGGHKDGKVASQLVVDSLMKLEAPKTDADQTDLLKECIEEINSELLKQQKALRSNMRSTVVSLVIDGENAQWANVGDSRLYYFHKGNLEAVTADHSVAYQKYKAGEITRAQIGQDEDQSSLLRTLGNAGRHHPDVSERVCLEAGDRFLLCSDGLWEYLLDEEILVDSLKADNAKKFAELLLARVWDRLPAENDNLSLITACIH